MKLLLLILGIGCYITSAAQTYKLKTPKIKVQSDVVQNLTNQTDYRKKVDSIYKSQKGYTFNYNTDYKERLGIMLKSPQTYVLNNKTAIITLPQDNMPCIIPNTQNIAPMPNAWPNVDTLFHTTIPNPGLKEQGKK